MVNILTCNTKHWKPVAMVIHIADSTWQSQTSVYFLAGIAHTSSHSKSVTFTVSFSAPPTAVSSASKPRALKKKKKLLYIKILCKKCYDTEEITTVIFAPNYFFFNTS